MGLNHWKIWIVGSGELLELDWASVHQTVLSSCVEGQ